MFGTNGSINTAALAVALALAALMPPGSVQAKGFRVLYSFKGRSDGSYPEASLMRDDAGNLYGTTLDGGANRAGTVFRLAPDGTERVLYSFGGTTGAHPTASLIRDKSGNLFGTTENGGANSDGTVFKLASDGTETVLYSFRGGNDGGNPLAGLVLKARNLYGTTQFGGVSGEGVVFRLAPDGSETVLHSFAGGTDGSRPLAGVMADRAGNFYGTTFLGGVEDLGTVFKIAADGTETIVHSFGGTGDGAKPGGALIADANGNLYGTTAAGGAHNAGTVFKLAPDRTESVLYSFAGGSDGADPSCTLVMDAAGNLYGTTPISDTDGDGAVFRLAPDGSLIALHSFSGADGADPYAGLIADKKGNLYGTTPESGAHGYGVVFRIKE